MKKVAAFFVVGATTSAWAGASYAADSTMTVTFTSAAPVPALSPVVMVLMVLSLGAIALLFVRRRVAPRVLMVAGGLMVAGLALFASPQAKANPATVPVSVTGSPTVVDLDTNGAGQYLLTNNTGAAIHITGINFDNQGGDSFQYFGISPCGVGSDIAPGDVCEIDVIEPA